MFLKLGSRSRFALSHSPCEVDSPSTPADVLGIIEDRQKRFQDYLTAKGVAKDRNPEALRIASERGKKDLATCETELEQFYKECAERCEKVEDESYPTCYDKCPHPDSCTRVGKCEKFSSVLKPDHCSLLFLSSRAVRRCSMGLFALFSEALTPALHHVLALRAMRRVGS